MQRIACVKFAGLASGGTERALQNIASILAQQDDYAVDYYYTNAAPFLNHWFVHPDNDNERKSWVEDFGVNTIPVYVESKEANVEPYIWNNTNFWDLFDETQYDVIQTARGGYPEYPFNLINRTKIIDGIHSDSGEDKENIVKAILISKWQAEKWAANGGNINKAVIIPNLVSVPDKFKSSLRTELEIPEDDFVYGFHQRNDPNIFSPVSLYAYSLISNPKNHFILLGGSDRHRELARQLNLNNIHFIDFSPNQNIIHNFLGAIDVYAHSRVDGEVCSVAMIEAMYHGKPIITHPGTVSMGHAEQIEGCGYMAYSVEDYANKLKEIENSKYLYQELSQKTLNRYMDKYSYDRVKQKIIDLYFEVLQ
ncbi:MAG: glycosyltransferase family 4 protein [Methanobacterium sp.]